MSKSRKFASNFVVVQNSIISFSSNSCREKNLKYSFLFTFKIQILTKIRQNHEYLPIYFVGSIFHKIVCIMNLSYINSRIPLTIDILRNFLHTSKVTLDTKHEKIRKKNEIKNNDSKIIRIHRHNFFLLAFEVQILTKTEILFVRFQKMWFQNCYHFTVSIGTLDKKHFTKAGLTEIGNKPLLKLVETGDDGNSNIRNIEKTILVYILYNQLSLLYKLFVIRLHNEIFQTKTKINC
ncbi:hypothetical protein AGLY_014724 [Aphis glycines]|uniref:Uncharacterized protein n=1 Tax=Aphis glycines TaxID=307491 RepID=A0A6G0T397_APHGL|nr:hypothetical protein AGLY_014724 [Aphis glycines]